MRILFLPLLKRKITPDVKSSRPRIIYELIQGMLKKGHTVDVLGTGDSIIPGAHMIPVVPHDWSSMPEYENMFYAETGTLALLAKKLKEIGNSYDIIHNHTYPEFINLLVASELKTPIVTTIHTQGFDLLDEVFHEFDDTYLISLSKAHKSLFKKTSIYRIVYNGIDTNTFTFQKKKDNYLLWLGRLSKAKDKNDRYLDPKGVRWAIQLARETNHRLILSGNVEDMDFYKTDVEPFLSDTIQWAGPVSSELSLPKEEIVKLMQNAKCFLMTINWFEPFGLVMAEAMACGTPVIGFDHGAVSEVIDHGKTGFVVNKTTGISGLKQALSQIHTISPEACRSHIEHNFSTEIMVSNYEKVYLDICKSHE